MMVTACFIGLDLSGAHRAVRTRQARSRKSNDIRVLVFKKPTVTDLGRSSGMGGSTAIDGFEADAEYRETMKNAQSARLARTPHVGCNHKLSGMPGRQVCCLARTSASIQHNDT